MANDQGGRLTAQATRPIAQAAAAFVQVDGLCKSFGTFTAVDNVSFEIERGEIFSLLGGSGCGKTTLLRMLAGFETPTRGRVLIDGQDMTDIPPYERPVNMMFQSYALFPHMTVERNIGYGLTHKRMSRAQRAERVAEMLDLVQLTDLAKRKPHQISGGQRQRVALARSLAKEPKLLLLDEPLAALDKKLREATQFELMSIQERTGVTFIVVTHDQEEAMTLSSRMAVMDKGRIVQVGTATEIYEFPKTRFVADFIGSINLFSGQVTRVEGDETLVEVAELGGPVRAATVPGIADGDAVTLAVRPEKLSIGRNRLDERNRIHGTVESLAYFGKDSLYRVRLASGRVILANAVNARRVGEGERHADWEDDVWCGFAPSSAILLTQ